jgi:hypothetical protein
MLEAWSFAKKVVTKRYNFAGRPGCVRIRKNKCTGADIGLYNARQAGLTEDGWVLVCERHQAKSIHSTFRMTLQYLVDPIWCAECNKIKKRST